MPTDPLPNPSGITAAISGGAPPADPPQDGDVVLEEEATATRAVRKRFARVTIPPGTYAASELTGRPVEEILQDVVDIGLKQIREHAVDALRLKG